MISNLYSIADWRPPETLPSDEPGSYLVILRDHERGKNELHVCRVARISNGCMMTIGGHFAFDMLDARRKIVAWAPAPEPPTWVET